MHIKSAHGVELLLKGELKQFTVALNLSQIK